MQRQGKGRRGGRRGGEEGGEGKGDEDEGGKGAMGDSSEDACWEC